METNKNKKNQICTCMTKQKVLVFFILLLLPVWNICTCFSSWIDDPNRGKVGWYGYEPLKKPEKKKKKQIPAVPKRISKVPEEEKTREEKIKWPTPEELYHMNASQIRKWLDKATDVAIGNPTEENVERWAVYKYIAERKAVEFTSMWKWVLRKHPELYITRAHFFLIPQAMGAFEKQKSKLIRDTINSISPDDFALLLFLKHDDEVSNALKYVIGIVKRRHPNLQVVYYYWPEDRRYFEKAGVSYVPQLWLLSRKKGLFPVYAGVRGVEDTEEILANTIQIATGKITPWEYIRTERNLIKFRRLFQGTKKD